LLVLLANHFYISVQGAMSLPRFGYKMAVRWSRKAAR